MPGPSPHKTDHSVTSAVYRHYPPLGAHTSTAGGLANAIRAGRRIGCDVVQIFSKNQMQWQGTDLTAAEIKLFGQTVTRNRVYPVSVHAAYLINLASPRPAVYQRSLEAFVDELARCEKLRIPYLIMHPGAHLGAGEEIGLKQIAGSITLALRQSDTQRVNILLETTAGQGTNLGYRFEQLATIIRQCALPERIGVCLDTCHVFAAGYDLRNKKVWEKTKRDFDRMIGLQKLKCIHLNDSVRELGSRVDRHARIGNGLIGRRGFRTLVNDRDLREIPMILEIPGGEQAYQEDLLLLRSMLDE